jgi:hypothetical protein
VFNGRNYIMEEAITGDYSLVKAWKVRTQSPYMIAHGGRTYNGHHTRDWIWIWIDDMRILETGVSRAELYHGGGHHRRLLPRQGLEGERTIAVHLGATSNGTDW